MTENKLSEQELQEIKEEAEKFLKLAYVRHTTKVNPDGNWADWETCKKDGTVEMVLEAMTKQAAAERLKPKGFPVGVNELCDILQSTCQLLLGIKPDAVEEKWWSKWDESVLQSNIEMLRKVQPFYNQNKEV